MHDIEVLVIGTDPPCPRCDLTAVRAHKAAEGLGLSVGITHCAFSSDEAGAVGRAAGRWLGTPGDVAKAAGITMDWDRRDLLVRERRMAVGETARPADVWTPALDAFLDPCREAADSVGYLMTPIVVVNGRVRHHGNVPDVALMRGWLRDP
jgi:hypothetical protein